MANRGSAVVFVMLFAVCAVVMSNLPMSAAADGNAGKSRVEIVLDLPYGSEAGSVGKIDLGDPALGSGPPMVPEMFQMTKDGTLWVLDNVNHRVLAFKDGKQITEVSTLGIIKSLALFGVTGNAFFIKKTTSENPGIVYSLLRYDRKSLTWDDVTLEIQRGVQLNPHRIRPLGSDDNALLIHGSLYRGPAVGDLDNQAPVSTSASIVLSNEGKIVQVLQDSGFIPGMDGSIWRLKVLDYTSPSNVPFVLEKYNSQSEEWDTASKGDLPRLPELYELKKDASVNPIGVDKQGRAVVMLSEGRPASYRFMQISPSGEVLKALTLEEFGFDSALLHKYPSSVNYQLLPDGSVLAHYASQERYRIIRIYF